jgi:hypothetical protein
MNKHGLVLVFSSDRTNYIYCAHTPVYYTLISDAVLSLTLSLSHLGYGFLLQRFT